MELIETSLFTRQIRIALSDDGYRAFQLSLLLRPDAGKVIRGSGGLRKVRWRVAGRGKRGGVRVIYYWKASESQIFLLFVFPKNARSDLSPRELRALRRLVRDD